MEKEIIILKEKVAKLEEELATLTSLFTSNLKKQITDIILEAGKDASIIVSS